MELKIDKSAIEAAIQEHLDKTVQEGISYKVKDALNDAIAKAVTPEIVAGFVEAAMGALTDPALTQRIVTEMNHAITEAIRMAMQESVVCVIANLRGLNRNRSKEDIERIEALRLKLFPTAP